MKVYCAHTDSPDTGDVLIWAASKREAESLQRAFCEENEAMGSIIVQHNVPTDRKGLVEWLNKHVTTDNG